MNVDPNLHLRAQNEYYILGVDPSWTTGLAFVAFDREWTQESGRIVRLGVADVRKEKTLEVKSPAQAKIKFVTERTYKFIEQDLDLLDAVAIELPFAGVQKQPGGKAAKTKGKPFGFRSKDLINQARLLQGLIDLAVTLNRYDAACSEIHATQAKAGIYKGTAKKAMVRIVVEEQLGITWPLKTTIPHKEAMCDAVAVAFGYARLKRLQAA